MKIIVVVKREAEAPIDKTNELWLRLCWWCTNTNGLPAAAATKDVCPPFVIILHSILGGDTQYPLGTLPTYQGVLGTLVLGDTLDHHLFSPHFVIVLSPFFQRNSFQNQISSLIFTDTHKYKLWGFTMMMSEWMPSLLHPNTGLCNVFWCVPWHNSVRNCHRLRAREALIFTALIFLQFDCGGYPPSPLDWGNPFNAGLLYQTCSRHPTTRPLDILSFSAAATALLTTDAPIRQQNCTFLNHRNHVASLALAIIVENIFLFNHNSFALHLHSLQMSILYLEDADLVQFFQKTTHLNFKLCKTQVPFDPSAKI